LKNRTAPIPRVGSSAWLAFPPSRFSRFRNLEIQAPTLLSFPEILNGTHDRIVREGALYDLKNPIRSRPHERAGDLLSVEGVHYDAANEVKISRKGMATFRKSDACVKHPLAIDVSFHV
jgi:hypothetical protein